MSSPRDEPSINPTAASVLGFLSIGPLTGWDLNEFAQVSVGHFWSLTRSQIYRELNALAELGLVEADEAGPRNRRRYQLTDLGRSRLHDWLREPAADPIQRNPFLVKLFFAGQLDAAERNQLIAQARARHEEFLATYESAIEMAEQLSPYAAATARYGAAVEQAIIGWFDDAPWER